MDRCFGQCGWCGVNWWFGLNVWPELAGWCGLGGSCGLDGWSRVGGRYRPLRGWGIVDAASEPIVICLVDWLLHCTGVKT